ncbi:MAG: PSD1 and planctomycete cytochrome C domain-containing protein [Pirellulales bacterium]
MTHGSEHAPPHRAVPSLLARRLKRWLVPLFVLLAQAVVLLPTLGAEERDEFFERRIRPLLVERCHRCHSGATDPQGGLRLDSRAALLRGSDEGPVVDLAQPDDSRLLRALRYASGVSEMPPDGQLTAAQIADVRQWLADGAVYPGGAAVADDTGAPRRVDIAGGRSFWSFQPLGRPQLPELAPTAAARRPLDLFILESLTSRGLAPAPPADRRVLLRRLSFDLRGLPPTRDELAEFLADESPDAVDRWVERFLAAPAYGEHLARRWLDVARYAEDQPTSESTCPPPRFPYRYRDWVIRAWNTDLGYDEQVRRQLAADHLDVPREEWAALGFLGLSPVYHTEPKLAADVIATIVADEWDERLDTITRGFLGLTVACARCHDHKYDPIRTEDYYALAGVLASTQLVEWPLVDTPLDTAVALTETQRRIIDAQLRVDYAKKMRDTAKLQGSELAPYEADVAARTAELQALKDTKLFDGPIANVARDAGLWIDGRDPAWTTLEYRAGQPRDLPVFLRGNANRPGPIVRRRFLEVLAPADAPPFPATTSGRRELAESLVTTAAPLSARVLVNRVWGWYFGEGLVRTPSNFGRLGDPPTHPRLLDDLAARFLETGWSLKWLVRELVSSTTWRQSCHAPAATVAADPTNLWLARATRRRLDAEPWRDAVLRTAHQLDLTAGGPSGKLDDPAFQRRTVYGAVSRQKPASLLKLFDFPDAKQHSERRLPTTTPLQHLYLLNSPFVQQAADALANQAIAAEPAAERQRVEWLFQQILLRAPNDDERREALALIAPTSGPDERPAAERWSLLAHALLVTNEFLYLE